MTIKLHVGVFKFVWFEHIFVKSNLSCYFSLWDTSINIQILGVIKTCSWKSSLFIVKARIGTKIVRYHMHDHNDTLHVFVFLWLMKSLLLSTKHIRAEWGSRVIDVIWIWKKSQLSDIEKKRVVWCVCVWSGRKEMKSEAVGQFFGSVTYVQCWLHSEQGRYSICTW